MPVHIFFVLVCLALFAPCHSFAAAGQNQNPRALEALVAEALRQNPELAFYEAELSAARGERRQAGAWSNPEFSTEAGRKTIRSGPASVEGAAWALSIEQTFEWPGRVSLRKAIANRQVDLAALGLERFRHALAAQVRQRAHALWAAHRRAEAAQEVAVRGEELVATLVQREPAGINPLLESRAIQAAVIKLKREVLEARREAQSALFELNQLRGRALGEAVSVADPILNFPELAPVEELIARAARGNFELKQRETELAQQGFKVRLAENEVWPSLKIGPRLSQDRAGDRETTATVGVSLTLPLWNRNEGAIQTANARLLQAATTLRLQQREIERKLRDKAVSYELNRRELARLDPRITDQLREAALLADRHFRLGAVPLATYLELQEKYLEALKAIFSNQADALSALAEIQLLTGPKPTQP